MQTIAVSNEITEFVKSQMDEKRFRHTMSVVGQCEVLAELFSLSEPERRELITAAWLHDLTKCKTYAENLEICRKYGVELDDDEIQSPKVLHQITGALIAREHFPNVVNNSVFNAVSVHTTGSVGMSLISKLLYLADYIEPLRTFPDCVNLRNHFNNAVIFDIKHLDETLILSFDMTINDIIRSGDILSPKTVLTRNYLIKTKKKTAK